MNSDFDLQDPGTWVLPRMLQTHARLRPDARWLGMLGAEAGQALSFGQGAEQMHRAAGHLAGLGVRRGESVAVLLPNGLDLVRVWLGLTRLGAVAVLLNPELRGAFLEHQLRDSGAARVVVHISLLAAVQAAAPEAPGVEHVVVVGEVAGALEPPPTAGLARLPWAGWQDATPCDAVLPQAGEIACVMYTSGTSGPAKGVLMPHAHCALYGIGAARALALKPADLYYIVLPLFHANGLLMQLGATLAVGMGAVLRERFSASAWLDDLRASGATVTNSLGAVAAYIVAQPPRAQDREHRLRAICSAPNLAAHDEVFRQRFGVRDVVPGYGMTEVNIPTWGRIGQPAPGAAGWLDADHFELQIVDPETDRPLGPGTPGEIVVRPKLPFGFMAGYLGRPEATVQAWRNLWFHTGDLGTLGSDGLLTFIDRIKDCIRRRGENISATEVEEAVLRALPQAVAEIAAFAVPASLPGAEDELMLAVVPAAGAALNAAQVAAAADAVLPRFAQPRYVELCTELPKTATGKVQRAPLRQRGVGADTWDREKDG